MATHEELPGDSRKGRYSYDGESLQVLTGLDPERLNDAIETLEQNGYVEVDKYLGTAPYDFGHVEMKSRGRAEAERLLTANSAPSRESQASGRVGEEPAATSAIPVGSPYGFTDHDWESVARHRKDPTKLIVVFGHQWESKVFTTQDLRKSVGEMFAGALAAVLSGHKDVNMVLDYRPLKGGYGEHLFNEIARDIISADIAVFDTSDMNANVMIEMGVALTWGTRVLPIHEKSAPRPPSDISGQTWVEYTDSGRSWTDPEHAEKLKAMVERAARKKQAI
jgi:hypothetical protein